MSHDIFLELSEDEFLLLTAAVWPAQHSVCLSAV